jgi:hypothetical protein
MISAEPGSKCDKCAETARIAASFNAVLRGGPAPTSGDTSVYPEYLLKVTYNEKTNTHGGYCSDSYDSNTTYKKITRQFPLLKQFKMADLDGTSVSPENAVLRKYYGDPNMSSVPMDKVYRDSCDCCGITYEIESATVVKKSDLIVLDY